MQGSVKISSFIVAAVIMVGSGEWRVGSGEWRVGGKLSKAFEPGFLSIQLTRNYYT